MKYNPDKIGMAHREHISKVAFEMLDRVQTEAPEHQMLAIGTLFAVACKRLNLDAHAEYMRCIRMLNPEPFENTGNGRYRAMLDYAGQELKGAA